ncbi:MAG: hypothetical protein ACXVGB_00025 [Mycobacteriaceae bacterium]
MRERLYFNRELGGDSADPSNQGDRGRPYDTFQAVTEEHATVITSLSAAPDFYHLPTLDIDLPCELRESSPGKYHLYIDKPMPWSQYRMLLDVLAQVGIIEQGYADASIEKRGSALRKPGTFKNATEMRAGSYDRETHVAIPVEQYQAMQALCDAVKPMAVFP